VSLVRIPEQPPFRLEVETDAMDAIYEPLQEQGFNISGPPVEKPGGVDVLRPGSRKVTTSSLHRDVGFQGLIFESGQRQGVAQRGPAKPQESRRRDATQNPYRQRGRLERLLAPQQLPWEGGQTKVHPCYCLPAPMSS
jgi:hypothetical protein